ncbi:8-oxoguanine DNA glycosylase OGG fold protein [Streptomyces cinerochromogenes]|uniref:8-oxoguanine DNA glycosylase OGG fold protein n=1 Tax=Streptomyces cinerochromogenes TaxID=66422 RepID=UPI0035713DB4
MPDAALQARHRWWRENTVGYADGRPGAHTVRYAPSRWAGIAPWPSALAPAPHTGDAWGSRTEVVSVVADALRREAFSEALVGTYVWGKGTRGTRRGSGPATRHMVLSRRRRRGDTGR